MNLEDILFFYQVKNSLKKATRDFFDNKKFIEVETPSLVCAPGTEVHLDYFKTEWIDYRSKACPLWLRSSPEIHLKKVLSFGIPKIYEIARCFRNNEDNSRWHHLEFDMLEWYDTSSGFLDFMKQTESYLQFSLERLKSRFSNKISYCLPKVFTKITVQEAFFDFCKIDLIDSDPDLGEKCQINQIGSIKKEDDFETAFFKALIECVEPQIKKQKAVVLYDYPASQAALAKVESGVAKRFEFYLDGIEICNAFYELTDVKENKKRIQEANTMRKKIGKEVTDEDKDFYRCLSNGIPACCGNALGLDRWLAVVLKNDGILKVF